MAAKENVATVKSLFEAFNRREWDKIASMCDPKFEVHNIATGDVMRGLDGCKQWFQYWGTVCSDMKVEVKVVGEGDKYVCIEGTARGTNDGPVILPMGRIEPTGRKLEMKWSDVYELRDGKIQLIRVYFDQIRMVRQLGATVQMTVPEHAGMPATH